MLEKKKKKNGIVYGSRAAREPIPGGGFVAHLERGGPVRVGPAGVSGPGVEPRGALVRREGAAPGALRGRRRRLRRHVRRVILFAPLPVLRGPGEGTEYGAHERLRAWCNAPDVLPLRLHHPPLRENQVGLLLSSQNRYRETRSKERALGFNSDGKRYQEKG